MAADEYTLLEEQRQRQREERALALEQNPPQEGGQGFSILDPIKQKGLSGLDDVLFNMVPGAAVGGSVKSKQTDEMSVADMFSSLGSVAKETAYYTPILGDVMGAGPSYASMVHGTDFLTQTLGALGFLGFADVGVMAGATIAGTGAYAARQASQLRGSKSTNPLQPHYHSSTSPYRNLETLPTWVTERLDGIPLVVGSSKQNMLSELAGAPDTAAKRYTMFALLNGESQSIQRALIDALHIDFDRRTGSRAQSQVNSFYGKLGEVLSGSGEASPHFLNFIEGVSEMLWSRSKHLHNLEGVDPDNYRAALTAALFSKWNFMMSKDALIFEDAFVGAGDSWRKVRETGEFTAADQEALLPAMKAFSEVTGDIGHPELVMLNDPRLQIDNIRMMENNGVPSAIIMLKVNQFEAIDPTSLSQWELNTRVRLLFKDNPEAMTHLAAQNILDFFNDHVLPNWETLKATGYGQAEWDGIDFYAMAKDDLHTFAKDNNLDKNVVVGVGALLSATTAWDVNLHNTATLVSWISTPQGKKAMFGKNDLGEYLYSTDKKVISKNPEASLLERIKQEAFGGSDAYMSNDQAKSIRSLFEHVESGGTVREWFEQQMTTATALKVPNFWKAIESSNFIDMEARQHVLYHILSGNVTLKDIGVNINSQTPAAKALREAFDTFPLTVDRHAFAIALGYSTDIMADSVGQAAYRPLKAAYMAAAASIGEIQTSRKSGQVIQGRKSPFPDTIDPNELQALTWLAWRELRGVTKNFKEVRGKNVDPLSKGRPDLHATGVGPTHVENNSVLQFVAGQLPEGVHLGGPKISAADQSVPMTQFGQAGRGTGVVTKQGVMQATQTGHSQAFIEVGPEGPRWVSRGEANAPSQFHYPSKATNDKGLAIWIPKTAATVDDASQELRRIMASTVDADGNTAMVGGRTYTSEHILFGLNAEAQGLSGVHAKGLHVRMSIPTGGRGAKGIDNTLAAIREHLNGKFVGVEPEFYVQQPHVGQATVIRHPHITNADGSPMDFYSEAALAEYIKQNPNRNLDPLDAEISPDLVSENRVELVISFDTPEDLALGHSLMTAHLAGLKSTSFDGVNSPYVSAATSAYIATQKKTIWGRKLKLGHQRMLRHRKPNGDPDPITVDPTAYEVIANHYDNYAAPTKEELLTGQFPDQFAKPIIKAWKAFEEEVITQYAYLTETMGIKVEVVDKNPYKTPLEMITDVKENNRIKVLSTESTGGHPWFSNEINDMFRALHDVFGHASEGPNFTRNGEFAAAAKHMQMFSEEAMPAVMFDLLGQNASLVKSGKFAEQKIGILPRGMWPDGNLHGKHNPFADKPNKHRVIDHGHQEDIVDYSVIAPDEHMPNGVVKVFEHYYVDPSGKVLVHNSKQGNTARRNQRRIGVLGGDNELESYLSGRTTRYEASEPMHGEIGGKPSSMSDKEWKESSQFQRRAGKGQEAFEAVEAGNTQYFGHPEPHGYGIPVRMVPIEELADLQDWSWNVSRRTDAEEAALAESIRVDGFGTPIQIMAAVKDDKLYIIAAQGNHRLAAARAAGVTHVPVIGRWDTDGILPSMGYAGVQHGSSGAKEIRRAPEVIENLRVESEKDLAVVVKNMQTKSQMRRKLQDPNASPIKLKKTKSKKEVFDAAMLFKHDEGTSVKTVLQDKELKDVVWDQTFMQPGKQTFLPEFGIEEGPYGKTWGGKIQIAEDPNAKVLTAAKHDVNAPTSIFGVTLEGEPLKSGANKGQPKKIKPKKVVMYIPESPTEMPIIKYDVDQIDGYDISRQVILQQAEAKSKGKDIKTQNAPAGKPNVVIRPLSTRGQDKRTKAGKEAPIGLVTTANEILKDSGLLFEEITVRPAD